METWKAIPNYKGIYEASNQGQVRRLAGRGCRKTRVLKQARSGDGYMTILLYKNGTRESCKVHQLIITTFCGKQPKSHQVDHIDRNPFNNKLDNLRFVTRAQNRMNTEKQQGRRQDSSQFKGVSRNKNRWRARICKDKDVVWLGNFEKEEDAARAYDKAACKLFGEFAYLNFPALGAI